MEVSSRSKSGRRSGTSTQSLTGQERALNAIKSVYSLEKINSADSEEFETCWRMLQQLQRHIWHTENMKKTEVINRIVNVSGLLIVFTQLAAKELELQAEVADKKAPDQAKGCRNLSKLLDRIVTDLLEIFPEVTKRLEHWKDHLQPSYLKEAIRFARIQKDWVHNVKDSQRIGLVSIPRTAAARWDFLVDVWTLLARHEDLFPEDHEYDAIPGHCVKAYIGLLYTKETRWDAVWEQRQKAACQAKEV